MAVKTTKPEKKEYTIREAAKRMGLTEAYVRTLIRHDKLPSTLKPIAFEAMTKRHMIAEEDIVQFLADTPRKTKRTDGRNKYVFYATPTEADAAIAVLRTAGMDDVAGFVRTANHIKPRFADEETENE